MDKRTRLFYKHFNFDTGSPYYSEYTPGDDASFHCLEGYWKMGNFDGADKFAKEIERAKTCKKFAPREG